jgi:hypothetical protein
MFDFPKGTKINKYAIAINIRYKILSSPCPMPMDFLPKNGFQEQGPDRELGRSRSSIAKHCMLRFRFIERFITN